ncbi:MAG: FAD-dependent oxidoreductase [Gammaproteobacteria bacterium]|nr:FAD-dependent oxidoreductase [Gammaproteobacteria bacterium]
MDQQLSRSFWLDEALARDDELPAAALAANTVADVCIVGGGYTGLWTAIQLKTAEPGLDVVLLERDLCGSGASGRNAGFILSWWSKFLSLVKLCGEHEALAIARASAAAVGSVIAFCHEHDIDADIRHEGWLWSATNRAQVGLWRGTIDAIAHHGAAPFVELNTDDVARRSGTRANLAGAYERDAARVQPALLARGLRRVALALGVRIHENTPLIDLEESSPPVVRTPRGAVTARKVVLAMNAWSIRWAPIRKAMVVVSGDMIVTPPIPERLAALGWQDGLPVSDGRALIHYWRGTRDGRLAFGKGGMSGAFSFGGTVGTEVEGASSLRGYLSDAMHATFPSLADVGVAKSWRGPVDRTRSGLPFFWYLDQARHIVFAAGFSGNGIGPCHLAGRILSSLTLERQDEWSACALVRAPTRDFPPEPFRYVGSKLIRRALLARDGADDAGRPVPLAARLLARLAPAGLSPFEAAKQDGAASIPTTPATHS